MAEPVEMDQSGQIGQNGIPWFGPMTHFITISTEYVNTPESTAIPH